MKKYFVLLALMMVTWPGIFAKRIPPPKVIPVTQAGITYSAAGDGRSGYVIASDARTGSELWRVKIYHVHINPFMEEDVQWIYISGLKLSGNDLLIRNEAARCYRLDLEKKSVRSYRCTEELSIKP
jgi:hypothetical protein